MCYVVLNNITERCILRFQMQRRIQCKQPLIECIKFKAEIDCYKILFYYYYIINNYGLLTKKMVIKVYSPPIAGG